MDTYVDNLKEIVKRRMLHMAHGPLHFKDWSKEYANIVEKRNTVKEKVFALFCMNNEYHTYTKNNRFQCRSGANRSVLDIWRLYKHYYNPNVSIFAIMKAIYDLIREEDRLSGHYCCTVHKLVFWVEDGSMYDPDLCGEIGVPFGEWHKFSREEVQDNINAA